MTGSDFQRPRYSKDSGRLSTTLSDYMETRLNSCVLDFGESKENKHAETMQFAMVSQLSKYLKLMTFQERCLSYAIECTSEKLLRLSVTINFTKDERR